MLDMETKERERLALQARLESRKTQAERNRLGQFATPTALAREIVSSARTLLTRERPIRFLDPAFGVGSFYSAFLKIFGGDVEHTASGFEIDPEYWQAASLLWRDQSIKIHHADFTKAQLPETEAEKASLLICNPPYVRHHHLDREEKRRLNAAVSARHGVSLSGLSGLYCYFMCLSKDWMARGGLAVWLVPSEFMDVNYGAAIKHFLLNHVSLLRIHRFLPEDVQFDDALTSSAIVWFKNQEPTPRQPVTFSLGGALSSPMLTGERSPGELHETAKWTSLPERKKRERKPADAVPSIGDFFEVKRGIATGANEFFILSPLEAEQLAIPEQFLIPILPGPRRLATDRIDSGADGLPQIDGYGFVFSTDMPEPAIRDAFPHVWRYLEKGRRIGIAERYLCRHRTPWYAQEKRNAAPILCTYMGRAGKRPDRGGKPFQFILNRSRAIAANVYLMLYPKPWLVESFSADQALVEEVWQRLQAIPAETLVGESRVYGGGLHKIEPKELRNVPAGEIARLFAPPTESRSRQLSLF